MHFWFPLTLAALSVSVDASSLAAAISLQRISRREQLRVAGTFGLFHFMNPLLGLLIGSQLAQAIGASAGKVGALALVALATWMLLRGLRGGHGHTQVRFTRGWDLGVAALSCSIDALVLGFSLGLLGAPILLAVTVVGLTVFVTSALAAMFANALGQRLIHQAELVSSLIVALLGVKFFLS